MSGTPTVENQTCPRAVLDLIERFRRNADAYKQLTYNETQVRREFIDPLFKALGWDVDNKGGLAEAYKDVIHEDAIKVGGITKAPDYCFRIGGTRKFFLEAKKPAVPLKDHPESAYQLRRYAWSAKLPLSILTDFEEMAVYDCRVRPHKDDKAAKGRTLYFTYDEYAARWGELAAIFSKDAVLKGSFDKYAESSRRKRGTAEVDGEILKEIESWRDALARNFALRNGDLSVRDLNFAVQRTVDRLLFLRLCEDRGIEPYGQLQSLRNGDAVYPRLGELFRKADDKYNSSLFYFSAEPGRASPDALTLGLDLDDKVLKDILGRLYYPDCPYEFSVLPPEILGQVYEQFLGKVIRLTRGHRAVVEDKPEVKKAGGVYYTPAYIVDYIVKHTVGKLLEGKKPKDVGPDRETKTGKARKLPKSAKMLRVLDPACGSGSFLLGAYEYLLAWHRDWYIKDGPEKHTDRIYQGPGGAWRLTIREKKRILLNNIYGVDIDSQAVEVTKLSLLLKVLEHESAETIGSTLRLFHERALPDLNANIKCGNSLIGPDFYDNQQMSLLDEEERYRINVFDWKAEFPEAFTPSPSKGNRRGEDESGFDVVIGNPPYIDSEWMTNYLPETRVYCVPRYQAASGNWDIFCVFSEKAMTLCRPGGFTSFIVPNKLASAEYAVGARTVLASRNRVLYIRDYSNVAVFPVAVYPIVYVVQANAPKMDADVCYERMAKGEDGFSVCSATHQLNYSRYFSDPERPWEIFATLGAVDPSSRMRDTFPSLRSVSEVLGAATVSEAYEMQTLITEAASPHLVRGLRVINSGTIDRYSSLWGLKPMRYLGSSLVRPIVSGCRTSELPHKRLTQARTPKIIVAGMTKRLECVVDLDGIILAAKSTTVVFSDLDLRYLLAILNSRLISFCYSVTYGANKLAGGYLRIGPPQLRTLPIATHPKRTQHRKITTLVQQILDLHKQLAAAKTPTDKTVIQRQIDATDRQIDRLVYELYELTDAEIAIVEEATR